MTPMQTPAAICCYCGLERAHVIPVTNGWMVIRDPEIGGCAATGVAGATEEEALTIWNVGLYASSGKRVA